MSSSIGEMLGDSARHQVLNTIETEEQKNFKKQPLSVHQTS